MANPKKPPQIESILRRNKDKLLAFLKNFHNDKDGACVLNGHVNLAPTNDWRRRTIHGREAVHHRANTELMRPRRATLASSAVRAISSASSIGTRPPSGSVTIRVITRVSCCTHTSRVLPSLCHVLLSPAPLYSLRAFALALYLTVLGLRLLQIAIVTCMSLSICIQPRVSSAKRCFAHQCISQRPHGIKTARKQRRHTAAGDEGEAALAARRRGSALGVTASGLCTFASYHHGSVTPSPRSIDYNVRLTYSSLYYGLEISTCATYSPLPRRRPSIVFAARSCHSARALLREDALSKYANHSSLYESSILMTFVVQFFRASHLDRRVPVLRVDDYPSRCDSLSTLVPALPILFCAVVLRIRKYSGRTGRTWRTRVVALHELAL